MTGSEDFEDKMPPPICAHCAEPITNDKEMCMCAESQEQVIKLTGFTQRIEKLIKDELGEDMIFALALSTGLDISTVSNGQNVPAFFMVAANHAANSEGRPVHTEASKKGMN